jgi:hypothetical protein
VTIRSSFRVDDNVTGNDTFTLNNMLGACDATTVVFFYNPLEHEKGKTMVRVYPNGTTVKGNGIHLESELKCAFRTQLT